MSLVVDDDYVGSVKAHLVKQCEDINSLANDYVKIMKEVINSGFMEGSTSESLKVFLEEVETNLEESDTNPFDLRSQIERFCANYIARINEADKDLY